MTKSIFIGVVLCTVLGATSNAFGQIGMFEMICNGCYKNQPFECSEITSLPSQKCQGWYTQAADGSHQFNATYCYRTGPDENGWYGRACSVDEEYEWNWAPTFSRVRYALNMENGLTCYMKSKGIYCFLASPCNCKRTKINGAWIWKCVTSPTSTTKGRIWQQIATGEQCTGVQSEPAPVDSDYFVDE